MTVNEYMTEWLNNKKPILRKSTYDAYENYINRHIIPFFDALGKEMDELIPLDVKRYADTKMVGGRLDGKSGGLCDTSVRKHLCIIKEAFREAELYGTVKRSPAEPVRLPRKKVPLSQRNQFIGLGQAQKILEAMEGHDLHDLVYITLIYGLRKSEALGLKWSAIDFEKGTLTVRHTVVKGTTIEAGDQTKTASSYRTFPLTGEAREVLERLKAEAPEGQEYVFSNENGGYMRPDSVTRSIQRALKKKGLPHMRFHDLRHATASIYFDEGWDVADVQHWLGHADYNTTMDIYVAYNQSRQLKMGKTIDGLFKNPRR